MYASISDLVSRLGAENLVALADDNHDGTADDSVIEAILQQASAMVDNYLAARYAVPVGITPLIVWLCVSLAVQLLYSRKREALPEGHKLQADAAKEFLTSLKDAVVGLAGVPPRTLAESTTRGEEKHFSPEKLSEF